MGRRRPIGSTGSSTTWLILSRSRARGSRRSSRAGCSPPLIGRLPPLSRLPVAERCAALEKLEHTPLGLPLLAVKAMLCILYYEHPDSLRDMGVTRGDEQAPGCLIPLRRGASS
jgi:hypothetical protein